MWWFAEFGEVPVTRGESFTTIEVSGHATPGSELYGVVGRASMNPDGFYRMSARPGANDIIAILPGTPAKLMFEHDLDVSGPLTLDLPIETDGVEMPTQTPTILGATVPPVVYSDVNTANDVYAELAEDPATVPVPPFALLRPTDRASIGAYAGDCIAQAKLATTAPELQMPGPLTTDFDRQRVAWTADPLIAWDGVSLDLVHGNAQHPFVEVFMTATTSWLDAVGRGATLHVPDLTSAGWPSGPVPLRGNGRRLGLRDHARRSDR